MKIYDCFMYFDEDLILDLRLNILDKFVDYFVIVVERSGATLHGVPLHFNKDIIIRFCNLLRL